MLHHFYYVSINFYLQWFAMVIDSTNYCIPTLHDFSTVFCSTYYSNRQWGKLLSRMFNLLFGSLYDRMTENVIITLLITVCIYTCLTFLS